MYPFVSAKVSTEKADFKRLGNSVGLIVGIMVGKGILVAVGVKVIVGVVAGVNVAVGVGDDVAGVTVD